MNEITIDEHEEKEKVDLAIQETISLLNKQSLREQDLLIFYTELGIAIGASIEKYTPETIPTIDEIQKKYYEAPTLGDALILQSNLLKTWIIQPQKTKEKRMTNMMRPLQYAVYKGMGGKFGALQLNFQSPHFYRGKDKDFTGEEALDSSGKLRKDDGWEQREGAVFLEVAPTVDKNKYDWGKKITVALSVTDMGKFIKSLTDGSEMTLTHDPGAKTESQGAVKKYINFKSPEGILEKGGLLGVNQVAGSEKMSINVPLSPDECLVIRSLFNTAISKSLNWT